MSIKYKCRTPLLWYTSKKKQMSNTASKKFIKAAHGIFTFYVNVTSISAICTAATLLGIAFFIAGTL